VVHGNDGGKPRKVEEKKEEKTTAKAVSPKATEQEAKRQKIAAVFDAVKALGGERPVISGRDAGAINATSATPEEIATAWLRLSRKQWPPANANVSARDRAFIDGNRVMWFAVDRLSAILAASTPTNGTSHLSPAAQAKLRRHEEIQARERNPRRDHSTPSPF
jgi:hypothetical protein